MADRTTLGVVSFLNSRPLIYGLEAQEGIRLLFDVPSKLPALLTENRAQAALVPVIEAARAGDAVRLVSDACIAADGPTMTVRVFSRVPPEDVRVIHTDSDSRTSVALARLIWSRWYKQSATLKPLTQPGRWDECEAVLLIGDKVVTSAPKDFEHHVDLGSVWKQWTGLPFVFAVWVARSDYNNPGLARILSSARDAGMANALAIAREQGPARGWPLEVAEAYLTQYMKYILSDSARTGLRKFLDMAAAEGLVTRSEAMVGS